MLELIKRKINKEMLKTGKMGTENVTIKLELEDKEMEEFNNLNLDNHYWFEKEGNIVYITYTEEI